MICINRTMKKVMIRGPIKDLMIKMCRRFTVKYYNRIHSRNEYKIKIFSGKSLED